MRAFLKPLRDRLAGNDSGVALAMVIGIGAVIFVLVAGLLSLAASAALKADQDEDWNAAAAAAYAGVADYQSRLITDNTYYKFGNPDAPFSAGSRASLTLPTSPNKNPAFELGLDGAWAPVPGAAGDAGYRYEVDSSEFSSSGVLRIRSTGRVGSSTRSVVANLKQKGFLDFLYFTDFETQDPAITGKSQAKCEKYYPDRKDGDCGDPIQFAPGEVVKGPVHSNDAMYICGGVFEGEVTSSYVHTPNYRDCGSATFRKGEPTWAKELPMPPTNTELRNETRADLKDTDVPRPGCLYTGPTTITYNGNGTMTVRSPWTKSVNIKKNSPDVVENYLCGKAGSGTNGLATSTGATIPLLVQNIIYVQTVPNAAGDPNTWRAGETPPIVCPTKGNGLGYPSTQASRSGSNTITKTETALSSPKGTAYYDCKAGDVFVKGKMDGQMTIAAENYIWIVGDLTYKDRSANVLGLIGQNAVWVWNPLGEIKTCRTTGGNCSTQNNKSLLSDTGRSIDAAILSVKHTFQVQNHDKGSQRGDLTVWGAIAQRFRGTVGTVDSTGYSKMYSYDVRFREIAPPKFLSPVSTTYGVTTYAEVAPAFKFDGMPIP